MNKVLCRVYLCVFFFLIRKFITEIFLKFITAILNDIILSKCGEGLQGLQCAFAKPQTGTPKEKCMRIKRDMSKQSLEHSSILFKHQKAVPY